MADPSSAGPRTGDDAPSPPRSIVELVRAGIVDSELAATVWVLVDGRVPVIVAGDPAAPAAERIVDALLALVDPSVTAIDVAGTDETFDWLPQAPDLGWRRSVASPPTRTGSPVTPGSVVLVARDLTPTPITHEAGEVARIAVRAATIGYCLLGIVDADGLDTVFATLRRPPIAVTDDELSRLGVVLVLEREPAGAAPVVTVAHYVRPVVRDEHGHVQRLGPAVLAAWDPAHARFEHFGWGITPELAHRVGRKAGDFEIDVDRRRALIEAAAAATATAATTETHPLVPTN